MIGLTNITEVIAGAISGPREIAAAAILETTNALTKIHRPDITHADRLARNNLPKKSGDIEIT